MGVQHSQDVRCKTGPDTSRLDKTKKRRKKKKSSVDRPNTDRGLPAGFQTHDDDIEENQHLTLNHLPDDLIDIMSPYLTTPGLIALGQATKSQQHFVAKVLVERKRHKNFNKDADAMVYFPTQPRTSVPAVGYCYVRLDQKVYARAVGDFRSWPGVREAVASLCDDPAQVNWVSTPPFFVACKFSFQPLEQSRPSRPLRPGTNVFEHAYGFDWERSLFHYVMTDLDNDDTVKVDILGKYNNPIEANQRLMELALEQSQVEIEQENTNAVPSASSDSVNIGDKRFFGGIGVLAELFSLQHQ